MGKNYTYENKIESRWRDTLIVCTTMFSSGPLDHEGLVYLASRGSSSSSSNKDPVEVLESSMDSEKSRKGVVRNNKNQKTRSKGPRPTDQDQKEWAPLMYFVHAVAGSIVAMMHKLGMFRLRINYGVKSVLEHLFDHILVTLNCLISSDDERNSSR
jgi:hypothetical protein